MRELLLSKAEKIAKNNKPYLIITTSDKEKEQHSYFVWENLDAMREVPEGTVLELTTKGTEYPEVTSFVKTDESSEGYIFYAFGGKGEARAKLNSLLALIIDPEIKPIIEGIFTEEFKERFITSPAAISHHHNYMGGLLEHTLEVTVFTQQIILNKKLLSDGFDEQVALAGAILHDIGKVEEYRVNAVGGIALAREIMLSSHLSTGSAEILALGDIGRTERARHIRHIIESHHHLKEWGAVAEPRTAEAELVFLADMWSARRNAVNHANWDEYGIQQKPYQLVKFGGDME